MICLIHPAEFGADIPLHRHKWNVLFVAAGRSSWSYTVQSGQMQECGDDSNIASFPALCKRQEGTQKSKYLHLQFSTPSSNKAPNWERCMFEVEWEMNS